MANVNVPKIYYIYYLQQAQKNAQSLFTQNNKWFEEKVCTIDQCFFKRVNVYILLL